MLNAFTHLLSGPQGTALLKGLKVLFLALFAISVFALLASPTVKRGKSSYTLLRVIFVFSVIAILCCQAYWQIFGFTHPQFSRFIRRYNRRPNAAELQVLRGPILDRRGMVLAAPIPGDIWGRRYPLGPAGVHPMGYYHSKYGITAVERVNDPLLSGYLPESDEEPLSKRLLTPRAKEGKEVSLTLDIRLQHHAYDKLDGKKGAVVVMTPNSGDLLALVSSPGFDPRSPAAAMLDDVNKPAFNRAVQGLYPPGSTFKPLIAGMAIDRGLNIALNCPGEGYIAGPHTPAIRDSEYYAYARRGAVWKGWGVISLKDAIVHSSNVYFAQLGVKCGTAPFNALMEKARINEPIRYLVGSIGELKSAKGFVPLIDKPRLLAQPAIGQGRLLVTPLHVACFTAAIAADGVMPTPRLAVTDPVDPGVTLFSAQAARAVRHAMREVVTRGTGKAAEIPGLEICGKTGTAQVPHGADHAWFTCFAPEKNPRIVVTVIVEHGGFGAQSALPIARDIIREADRLGYLKTARKTADREGAALPARLLAQGGFR